MTPTSLWAPDQAWRDT